MPIEYAIGLAFLTTGLGFLGNRLLDKLRHADRVTSLDSDNVRLKDTLAIERELRAKSDEHNLALQNEIANLKSQHAAEILDIQNRLLEHEDQKRILARHTFEESTGTYTNKTEHRFCSKCLLKTDTVESPLKPTQYGWQCMACNFQFTDPNNPPPQPVFHTSTR